jgi:hypothetical protein
MSIADAFLERNRVVATEEMKDLMKFLVEELVVALESEEGAELWKAAKKRGKN